jgi:hypothetical protein
MYLNAHVESGPISSVELMRHQHSSALQLWIHSQPGAIALDVDEVDWLLGALTRAKELIAQTPADVTGTFLQLFPPREQAPQSPTFDDPLVTSFGDLYPSNLIPSEPSGVPPHDNPKPRWFRRNKSKRRRDGGILR